MSWLDPVRVALDGLDTPCPVFFRDDDAGWGDGELTALLDVFEGYGVPVDLAVIPAALHPVLTAQLRARRAGSGVRLHQHGYRHVDHEAEGRKHEFGPSRDAEAQAADIQRGQGLLAAAFGTEVDPVFTPPWNRCTEVTAEALVRNGVTVLSRDHTAGRVDRPGLAEVPVTVDWFGKTKGEPWSRAELAARLATEFAAGGPVGVMLHHAVTADAERAAVAELVGLVAAHPAAVPTTIVELATR